MNTGTQATQKILSFLQGDEKYLLLTGTHQYKKHALALAITLSEYPPPTTILFRADHMRGLRVHLKLDREPKPRKPIVVHDGHTLFGDTINPKTWRSSPRNIDVAIVYPVDSLKYDAGGECVRDLTRRGAKKIFLVSCTDNTDFSWTEYFNPVHVTYDAEEEDPEYHRRMIEHSSPQPVFDPSSLPAYAASTPQEFLVKFWCRGKCRKTRWARMDSPYPGRVALQEAQLGQYRARCLKCGYEATDVSNWYR